MTQTLIKPLPMRAIDWWLANIRFPVLAAGLSIAFPMIFAYSISGAIYPDTVEPWDENPLELTGLFLMLSILPAYLFMCLIALLRLGNCNRTYIEKQIPDTELLRIVLRRWYPWSWLFIPFGIINIYPNIGTINLSPSSDMFTVSIGIVFGQWLLWTSVGLTLFFSLQEAFVLHAMGKAIPVNLYDLNSLNGFGKNALNNFMMIAGALALTTLQSIDQRFEWENYRNGILVGIPAALILVPLPIWELHKRIKAEKRELLGKIDQKIRGTSTALDSQALEEMNELLIRREQIMKLRNWPMDLSIFSRFFIYGFFVPLAWAGAALMEVFLDSILGL